MFSKKLEKIAKEMGAEYTLVPLPNTTRQMFCQRITKRIRWGTLVVDVTPSTLCGTPAYLIKKRYEYADYRTPNETSFAAISKRERNKKVRELLLAP